MGRGLRLLVLLGTMSKFKPLIIWWLVEGVGRVKISGTGEDGWLTWLLLF